MRRVTLGIHAESTVLDVGKEQIDEALLGIHAARSSQRASRMSVRVRT